jgi:Ribosomal protein S1
MNPVTDGINNEGDVELKLVMPLLTQESPLGLGLPLSYIQAKSNIRRFLIGKGSDKKLYFPDFLIVVAGIPLAVIEAKGPGEDVDEALRQTRLYAAELNAIFPSGTNPVQFVFAVNDDKVLLGRWDQSAAILDTNWSMVTPYAEQYVTLQNAIGRQAIESQFLRFSDNQSVPELRKPRRLLGGSSVQNEEIGTNSFGATIAADFAHIFNPTTRQDRKFIAHNGYISSRRRERYIDPIDKVIRASSPPSEIHTIAIDDTGKPNEVVSRFKNLKPLEHQVLLLVGSAGAGKSTFVDYLSEVALPGDVRNATTWVRVNMNGAPVSHDEIYAWLRGQIVEGCQGEYPELDFDDLATMQNVYSVEVNKWKKGVGQLYSEPTVYKEQLAHHLENLQKDRHLTAVAFTRYCATDRRKLLVVVLDNCDKRTRDEQLLMFQAAQWVQKEFRGLVILPLREETFDTHRDKPPLDTALKDLVFRIEAPLFQTLLINRVQLALNEIGKSLPKTLSYELANGFRVEYPASDMAFYLTSIVKSIFDHDRYIRSMIVGLSARNMRRAMELFLEFCTSGHIPEEQIFRIRSSEGKHTLPLHLVTRVLLRMNRRYYDNDYSYLKNILAANWQDERPSYFIRLAILRWFYRRISEFGPSREKGYFSIQTLKKQLAPLGFELKVIDREIEALLKAHCLISEDFAVDAVADETLVRIAPAGIVHLDLVGNIDYLGAVAEDTYMPEHLARKVAERISDPQRHYTRRTFLANASDLVDYLHDVRQKGAALTGLFLDTNPFWELTDIDSAIAAVKSEESRDAEPWKAIRQRYARGAIVFGTVVNVTSVGAFVELEPGLTSLLHRAQFPPTNTGGWVPMTGDHIQVKVFNLDEARKRVRVNFHRFVSDEEFAEAKPANM